MPISNQFAHDLLQQIILHFPWLLYVFVYWWWFNGCHCNIANWLLIVSLTTSQMTGAKKRKREKEKKSINIKKKNRSEAKCHIILLFFFVCTNWSQIQNYRLVFELQQIEMCCRVCVCFFSEMSKSSIYAHNGHELFVCWMSRFCNRINNNSKRIGKICRVLK